MKLLHLYAGNLYGGIERMLGTLARQERTFPELSHQFALCFRGKLWDELEACGKQVYDLGGIRVRYPWTVWFARRRLAAILAQEQPDWVICHTPWPHAIFGGFLRRRGVKFATWFHDVPHPEKPLDKWAGRTVPDRLISNSQYTAQQIPRLFPNARIEIIHYASEVVNKPLSPERRQELRQAETATPSDVVILQSSRFERWKGLHVFVQALGLLKDVPGWKAWLAGAPQKAGEDEYQRELVDLVAKLGLADRFRFLGWRSDMPELMQASDIFCQPNTGPEPFGLVFTEALAAGLPVVATALGGAQEIVTSECGFLVPPDDPAAVADALKRLIEDPALRQRLGQAGPKRATELVEPQRQLRRLQQWLRQDDTP